MDKPKKEIKRLAISVSDADFLAGILEREIKEAADDVSGCNESIDYLVACCDIFQRIRCAIAAYKEGQEWIIEI